MNKKLIDAIEAILIIVVTALALYVAYVDELLAAKRKN